ncbi:hypothetical protein WISP_125560 [Willisornis vidua]|uniref:Fibronectin type-III domain-containing protein n=1 Tax=Willisornis vidua TaxID=1566151 RepID=A0ABQ9CVS9_9PASS|nr:hypothetical protein WISP_125560 [Willisornis vidua]
MGRVLRADVPLVWKEVLQQRHLCLRAGRYIFDECLGKNSTAASFRDEEEHYCDFYDQSSIREDEELSARSCLSACNGPFVLVNGKQLSVMGLFHCTCFHLSDWDNELVCYKELSEDLTCTWLPVPSAPNTVNYTVYLKWNKIRKLFQRNTSSPHITIERKNLYIERYAYIWVAVNYAHGSCVKGKNISVLPSKAGKCLAPSNINAHQITNRLIIKWDLPTTPTPYELRYRESLTKSTEWTLAELSQFPQPFLMGELLHSCIQFGVPPLDLLQQVNVPHVLRTPELDPALQVHVESNAANVTILNLNAMSSYIVQLRCIANDGLNCVCIWSKEILVPHKLMNKPRISYNETTQIYPGRRRVLLKWEVTQSKNILGYFVKVERIPNNCSDSPNRIFLKDRKILLNLSMAYYRVNISAHNEAGESPQAIYIVPELSTTDLPGQIQVKRQGTNTVVTWTPEYKPKCFVVDWGTGEEDMHMKIVTTTTGNFTLENFQPYKMYKIMVHASDVCQCESFMGHEKTFGVTHFYSIEGGCNTSIPGKVMEQLILDATSKHVEGKIIRSSGYGCTKGKSCLTNLTVFRDGRTARIDEGGAVNVAYRDTSMLLALLPITSLQASRGSISFMSG